VWVRRPVVACALGRHLHAVLRVVHQGGHAVARGRTGLDLVPLFEAAPNSRPSITDSRRSDFGFHLSMRVPSSDSRSRSASRQMPKLTERGWVGAI